MLHYKVSVFLELHSSHSIGLVNPCPHDVLFVVALEYEEVKKNADYCRKNYACDYEDYCLVAALLYSCTALEARLILRLTEWLLRLVELRLLWLVELRLTEWLLRLTEWLLWLVELRLLRLTERLLSAAHCCCGIVCKGSSAFSAEYGVVLKHCSALGTSFHHYHPFFEMRLSVPQLFQIIIIYLPN